MAGPFPSLTRRVRAKRRSGASPTRTSTEQPTVQDGFPSTWFWHKRWTSEDFPTPASAQRTRAGGQQLWPNADSPGGSGRRPPASARPRRQRRRRAEPRAAAGAPALPAPGQAAAGGQDPAAGLPGAAVRRGRGHAPGGRGWGTLTGVAQHQHLDPV